MQRVCTFLSLAATLLTLSLGCETRDPHGRRAISGQVTFRGEALDNGSIKFLSAENPGMMAGSMIMKGTYHVPREQGLSPGTYRVWISALEPTPPLTGAPGENPAPPAKERIPEEYNVASKVTVEIRADQDAKFDFTIK